MGALFFRELNSLSCKGFGAAQCGWLPQGTEYSVVASPPVWAMCQKQDSREAGEGDTATVVKKQNHVEDWPENQAAS